MTPNAENCKDDIQITRIKEACDKQDEQILDTKWDLPTYGIKCSDVGCTEKFQCLRKGLSHDRLTSHSIIPCLFFCCFSKHQGSWILVVLILCQKFGGLGMLLVVVGVAGRGRGRDKKFRFKFSNSE